MSSLAGAAAEPPRALTALPEGGVAPSYDGRGITNLPASILHCLGVPAAGCAPPLARDLLDSGGHTTACPVLQLTVDGLGYAQLQDHLRRHPDGALATLAEGGALHPITSTLPSTTAAALNSLHTGLPPLRHGVTGYRALLGEQGVVANMIRFAPAAGGATLEAQGLTPEAFQPAPTLTSRLARAGVPARAVVPRAYTQSPLSRMLYKGVQPRGAVTPVDAIVQARRALEETPGPGFVSAYWDSLDATAHAYGPRSAEHHAVLRSLDHALQSELLDPLRGRDALLIVTADHGHVEIPREKRVRLGDHPDLQRHLVVPPTGDGRLAYLHARPGRVEAARDYAEARLGHAFAVLDADDAVARGLFGDGPAGEGARARLGDLVLVARDGHMLDAGPGEEAPPVVGHHGAAAQAEMVVPLLVAPLE